MYKCLILDVIQPQAKELLRKHTETTEIEVISGEELKKIIHQFDVMLTRNRPATPHDIVDNMTSMKAVVVAGAGTDSIDVEYARQKGIMVQNVPGVMADSVAGLTIGMIVFLLHEAHRAIADVKNGHWDRSRYESHQLAGKTVGIVAFGNIGTKVARILNAMDCQVLTYDPFITAEDAAAQNVRKVDLNELLQISDVVSVHAPLIDSTKNMISAPQLAMMKPESYLVNLGRGGLVNEDDLYSALKSGRIKGAASDVMAKEPCPSSPLYELPNFFATPHFAGVTVEARRLVDMAAARKVLAALDIKAED